jgi:hypothetical protein
MNAKIDNLTKKYGQGKWIEVGTLCTNNPDEKMDIIAKFQSNRIAESFAKWYNDNYAGFHTIIIR